MQLEIPIETVVAVAEICAEMNVPVILNPAPAAELPDELLRKVSVITPNEHEAESLTGIKVVDDETAAQASAVFISKGVKMVVITMGSKGAYVYGDGNSGFAPPFKVKAVDTTAAGDVFNGALAVALAEGKGIMEAVRFANAAGALSVTRLGAQPSAPKRPEILRFLKSAGY